MTLNLLIVLVLIGGWFSGKFTSRIGFPSVLGMIVWGILLGLWGKQPDSLFPGSDQPLSEVSCPDRHSAPGRVGDPEGDSGQGRPVGPPDVIRSLSV